MASVRTLLGYVKGQKGDKGDTGNTGAQGIPGTAATIRVGSTTTSAAGTAALVENVGTQNAAVLNFTIPQGQPGNIGEIAQYQVNQITSASGKYPVPVVGDPIAVITGKQAKATQDAQSDISSILGDFATVETTSTASKAYAVGDYLVKDGQFYKVTTAIAQGNTLTVGGNFEATNVGAEVSALNNDLSHYPDYTTQSTKADVTLNTSSPTDTQLYTAEANMYLCLTGITQGNGTGSVSFYLNGKPIFGIGSANAERVVTFAPVKRGDTVMARRNSGGVARCIVYGFDLR